MPDYTPTEFMIVCSSRALRNERVVFVGVGLPGVACNLALRTVNPTMEMVYESGVFGAKPERSPLSIGDPTLISGSTMTCAQGELFMYYLQGGRIDVALMGAAQIDRFGNLNSTVIGPYEKPKIRLPGSGGACEIAIHSKKLFMIMRLKKRAFVNQLDFATSPGYIHGGRGERAALGIPGTGPQLVVTDMALFRFAADTGEMTLTALRPGVTVEQVQAEVNWPLQVSADVKTEDPPTAEELRIIREEIDPKGIHTE
ncbi:MAG: CoA-transferase subunit beta [Syntrophales bacterium]